ncbi:MULTISPECIES: SMI1/KNR4 family protein [Bacillus amyloliquefaciens group]|uniref:SMI1/KNR4 family protein n=1 Tax=Bacillus amyloliquefaciens group TaxID=1938374 RepID=UPI00255B9CBC|nr:MULTISPECIES: SMI1/KNR4 family protein [Bacillus amyloliquefaciens group]MDL5024322.1 SMI1/KNR4 family protein [Bacillus velezensis]MEC1392957.1 SMI1/KNR4 family protein [Bacillus velezensis]MEC3610811.1 SMI1/KNR4 family protein [Bacillus velezensis]MEC3679492.1 SMI1/KNR4 family protein [Bacillus velezensis]
MKYDFIKTYKENTFYPVSENEILEVENKLGSRLPYDLRQFLLEVGYGFLKKSEYNINRILGPASIRKFYCVVYRNEELELKRRF